MRLAALLCLLLACAPGDAAAVSETDTDIAQQELEPPPQATPVFHAIILQGLNKVTGRISTLEGITGTVLRFGNLEIVPRKCWKSAPEDRPENAALLQISELRPGEAPQPVFLGWVYSSSPGLSGLEHPVYDITVIACKAEAEPEPETTEPPEAKKEKAPEKKDAAKSKAPARHSAE